MWACIISSHRAKRLPSKIDNTRWIRLISLSRNSAKFNLCIIFNILGLDLVRSYLDLVRSYLDLGRDLVRSNLDLDLVSIYSLDLDYIVRMNCRPGTLIIDIVESLSSQVISVFVYGI